jgi:predicted hydrocarbon binding protein
LIEVLEKEQGFLFRFENFVEIETRLENLFLSASSVMLWEMGKACGLNIFKRIMEKSRTKEQAIKLFSELKRQENWGEIIFTELDINKCSGRVIAKGLFEARHRESDKPVCHFFRGVIAGFLSELFSKDIIVTEQKCVGKKRCSLRIRVYDKIVAS